MRMALFLRLTKYKENWDFCFFLVFTRNREKSGINSFKVWIPMLGVSLPAFTLPSILSHDPRGKVGCVAAPRVLLFTPVLLFIMHRLKGTEAIASSHHRMTRYAKHDS